MNKPPANPRKNFETIFLVSRSRFLLGNAMKGAKAPDQFGRIHPDDSAAGKFPLQNFQGRFVVLFMPRLNIARWQTISLSDNLWP